MSQIITQSYSVLPTVYCMYGTPFDILNHFARLERIVHTGKLKLFQPFYCPAVISSINLVKSPGNKQTVTVESMMVSMCLH